MRAKKLFSEFARDQNKGVYPEWVHGGKAADGSVADVKHSALGALIAKYAKAEAEAHARSNGWGGGKNMHEHLPDGEVLFPDPISHKSAGALPCAVDFVMRGRKIELLMPDIITRTTGGFEVCCHKCKKKAERQGLGSYARVVQGSDDINYAISPSYKCKNKDCGACRTPTKQAGRWLALRGNAPQLHRNCAGHLA